MKEFLRKHPKKSLVLLLCVLVSLIFVFRSCSEDERIAKHVYLIGRDPSWYPLDFVGRDSNMVAFTNELLYEIGKNQQFRLEFVRSGSKSLRRGLDSGRFDAIITSLQPSPYNQDNYIFSDLIYLVGPVLVMRADEDLASLDKSKGRIIGVQQENSTVIEDPKRYPHLRLKIYDQMRMALDDLTRNEIDAVIMDGIPAHNFANGFYEGKIKVVTDPLSDEGLRLMTLKTHLGENLIEKFNTGLKEMLGNGVYVDLLHKWQITNTVLDTDKFELIDGTLEYRPKVEEQEEKQNTTAD